MPPKDTRKILIAKHKAIRVLLDTGSSRDLLFLEKGSNKYVPVVSRAVPESWNTSNGTFKTKKVGENNSPLLCILQAKRCTCTRI